MFSLLVSKIYLPKVTYWFFLWNSLAVKNCIYFHTHLHMLDSSCCSLHLVTGKMASSHLKDVIVFILTCRSSKRILQDLIYALICPQYCQEKTLQMEIHPLQRLDCATDKTSPVLHIVYSWNTKKKKKILRIVDRAIFP